MAGISIYPTVSSGALPLDPTETIVPSLKLSPTATPILRPFHFTADKASRLLDVNFDGEEALLANDPAFDSKVLETDIIAIQTTPPLVDAYVSWYERVEAAYRGHLKTMGLHSSIKLSTAPFVLDYELVSIVSCFSNVNTNTFAFLFGMVSMTLLDVTMLTGLPVVGQDVVFLKNSQKQYEVPNGGRNSEDTQLLV